MDSRINFFYVTYKQSTDTYEVRMTETTIYRDYMWNVEVPSGRVLVRLNGHHTNLHISYRMKTA